MGKTIKPEQLQKAIEQELKLYSKSITKGLFEEADISMKKLVKQTKATSPVGKRAKHYKSNITSKTLVKTAIKKILLWYVKGSDYRLSHLLNNGHALRNGGRYSGTQFITKAHDQIIKEYEKAVEKRIENGR